VYLVNDLDLIRRVLYKDAGRYHRGELFARIRPYIGDSVNVADGAKHRMLRRIYLPAFQPATLEANMDGVAGLIQERVRGWAPGAHDNLYGELYDLVLMLGARIFFPAQFGEKAMRTISDAVPGLVQGLFLRVISPLGILERLPLAVNRRFELSTAQLRAICADLLQQYRQQSAKAGDDLVSRLVTSQDPSTGELLTDEQVQAELTALVLTSSVTASATLGWCCRLLSTNPALQAAVRREVDDVLGTGERPVTSADLKQLTLTQAVVKEALRFRPPVHLLTREPVEDVELGGHVIPAGSTIVLSIYAIQHDPAFFPDPECFDPYRWLTEGNDRANGDAFLAFAIGLHACLGGYLATMEVAMILAAISRCWELSPPATGIPDRPAGALLNPGPVPMVLRARKS
jgi:pentalenene oxygenase